MPEEQNDQTEQQPDQLAALYGEIRDQNTEIIALLKEIRDKKPTPAGNAGTRQRVDLYRIGRD